MAQRVFVMARKQLVAWVTVGGVIAFLAGAIGYGRLTRLARQMVESKVEHISKVAVSNDLQHAVDKAKADIGQSSADLHVYVGRAMSAVDIAPLSGRGDATRLALSVQDHRPLVDASSRMLPARDAGAEGSAVGFALAAAMEYQVRRHEGRPVRLSPRYLYYLARKARRGDLRADGGAAVKDAVQGLAASGAVAENAWPYKAGDAADAPPAGVARARRYQITGRQPLHGINQIRSALRLYGPVVASVAVYTSFDAPRTVTTGVVADPGPRDAVRGSLPICIVGYDNARSRFKFLNSWGPHWGLRGYGYLSYDYVKHYGSDAWAVAA